MSVGPSSIEEECERALRRSPALRAPDLVELIHRVNPTGQGLRGSAESRRYALKSRLQSLLIREFRSQLRVEPVSGKQDVVTLKFAPQDRDACHAILDELDEEARSWVRMTLDLGTGDIRASSQPSAPRSKGAGAKPPPPPSNPDALLESGRAALESYDFEEARRCFQGAFDATDGAGPAAAALLALLVDHLASYEEALALESALHKDASKSGDVRALLAFAAAQLGRTREAWRFAERIEDAVQAATPLAVTAKAALGAGDWPSAESALARARKLSCLHPELSDLAAELGRVAPPRDGRGKRPSSGLQAWATTQRQSARRAQSSRNGRTARSPGASSGRSPSARGARRRSMTRGKGRRPSRRATSPRPGSPFARPSKRA